MITRVSRVHRTAVTKVVIAAASAHPASCVLLLICAHYWWLTICPDCSGPRA